MDYLPLESSFQLRVLSPGGQQFELVPAGSERPQHTHQSAPSLRIVDIGPTQERKVWCYYFRALSKYFPKIWELTIASFVKKYQK